MVPEPTADDGRIDAEDDARPKFDRDDQITDDFGLDARNTTTIDLPTSSVRDVERLQLARDEVFALTNTLIHVEADLTKGLESPRLYLRRDQRRESRSYGKALGYLAALRDRKETEWDDETWQGLSDVPVVMSSTVTAHDWQIVEAEEDGDHDEWEPGKQYLADAADPSDLARVVFANGTVLFGGTLDVQLMDLDPDELETLRGFVDEADGYADSAAEHAQIVYGE